MAKFTDTDLIVALNIHGGNVTKAAEELGVSRAAVIKRRKNLPAGVLAPDIKEFRVKRADIFAEVQKLALQYITPDKLKKASLQQLATLLGVMYDKERLEKGLATEHIARVNYDVLDKETKKQLKEFTKNYTEKKLKAVTYEDD